MNKTRVRAITVGFDVSQYSPDNLKQRIKHFFTEADLLFKKNSLPVQTRRLTLPPQELIDHVSCYEMKSLLDTITRISEESHIRWTCLPLLCKKNWSPEWIRIITNLIASYPKVFLHFMATNQGKILNHLPRAFAKVILAVSKLSNNGYDNFRIGMGANINPNTPYFPFSYHQGKKGFSLAIELIELIISIVQASSNMSLEYIREKLIQEITPIVKKIDTIGKELEIKTGMEYKGQDISIAPFPDNDRSVGLLIEMLGPASCGQAGTLFVTSLLTDMLKTVIQKTEIKAAGFNGVMFSLLEDKYLARSNNCRQLSLEKLMLYSTVCGCGIDMVPVPGDIFEEEVISLVLDLAGLSTVLKKPLGLRVLPIPFKKTNEFTHFNHDFLTNTRIMQLDAQSLSIPLSAEEKLSYLFY